MCFKLGAIFTLSGKPLKLIDKFTYHNSNISSTESNVHIHLAEVWNAIDRLSLTWKSDIFDEIK